MCFYVCNTMLIDRHIDEYKYTYTYMSLPFTIIVPYLIFAHS